MPSYQWRLAALAGGQVLLPALPGGEEEEGTQQYGLIFFLSKSHDSHSALDR